jgi:hypothetical protein
MELADEPLGFQLNLPPERRQLVSLNRPRPEVLESIFQVVFLTDTQPRQDQRVSVIDVSVISRELLAEPSFAKSSSSNGRFLDVMMPFKADQDRRRAGQQKPHIPPDGEPFLAFVRRLQIIKFIERRKL